jgi:hypothetical protein
MVYTDVTKPLILTPPTGKDHIQAVYGPSPRSGISPGYFVPYPDLGCVPNDNVLYNGALLYPITRQSDRRFYGIRSDRQLFSSVNYASKSPAAAIGFLSSAVEVSGVKTILFNYNGNIMVPKSGSDRVVRLRLNINWSRATNYRVGWASYNTSTGVILGAQIYTNLSHTAGLYKLDITHDWNWTEQQWLTYAWFPFISLERDMTADEMSNAYNTSSSLNILTNMDQGFRWNTQAEAEAAYGQLRSL